MALSRTSRTSAALACALLCAAALTSGASAAEPAPTAKLRSFASLPDWSGVWQLTGPGGSFDPTLTMPKGGQGGLPGVTVAAPLTPEWQKKYAANNARVAADRFPDPVSFCGTPSGFPRLLTIPDGYEFVIRPEQVWILTENGPNVARIYTDGRGHLPADEIWSTYSGDSIGHWEGDTLVFETIAMVGDGSAILDRSGLTLSGKHKVTTRLRKIEPDILESQMTIEDPVALARPWTVVRHYKRQPAGSRLFDYVCTENNRNPITTTGQTLTLDTSGKVVDQKVDKAP